MIESTKAAPYGGSNGVGVVQVALAYLSQCLADSPELVHLVLGSVRHVACSITTRPYS